MPTLKEVLTDKAKYGDNLVWKFDDTTSVTLGQLRQLSDEKQSQLSKQETDLAAKQAAIDSDAKKLKDSQIQTATVFTELTQAIEAIKSGRFQDPTVQKFFGGANIPGVAPIVTDPFAELSRLESDTLLGPVVKVMRSVSEQAKKAQDAVANNVEIQKRMATNYLNGVLEDRYDRLVPVDKQDKITLEMLIRDAVTHGEMKSDSTPDIRKAYLRATAADTQATHDAKVAQDAINKYKEEHPDNNAINVPLGTNFGLDVHNRSGNAVQPFKSLDAAFEAAAKDKDIWSQVDGQTH